MVQSEIRNLLAGIGTLTYRFTISVSIAVLVAIIILSFFRILWRRFFPEKKLLLLLPSETTPRYLGKAVAKGFVFYQRCIR